MAVTGEAISGLPAPAFEKNNIPVFFSCDDRFLPHTMVTAASIMENGFWGNNYDLIILSEGFDRDKQARATEWIGRYPNGSLRFFDITPWLPEKADFYVAGAFPRSAYFNLYAPEVFYQYDKIVYLDSDLVVLADIAGLYGHDVGENLLTAVHDYLVEADLNDPRPAAGSHGEWCVNNIGFGPGDAYFNAGVLLLNLRQMREENFGTKLLEAVRTIKAPPLADQDILNYACKGRVEFTDMGWNFQQWMAETEESSVKFRFADPGLREACRRGRKNVGILHYVEDKPWNFPYGGINGGYYWRYSAMTPFHGLTESELRRQSTAWKRLGFFAYLSLHLARCWLLYPFASPERKKRFRRRRADHWLKLKAMAKPSRRFDLNLAGCDHVSKGVRTSL